MSTRQIEGALNGLRQDLIVMAGYVEEAIELSTRVWQDRDQDKISRVFEIEDKVNQAHKDVDAACFKILALQQPLAVDLRYILAVIKINGDLERMVDQAVNIVHNAEYYLKSPAAFKLDDLIRMAHDVRLMVREAIDAFVKGDERLAEHVLKADDKVDQFKDEIFRDVQDRVKKDPALVEQGLNIILIARNLERIGDHATNIAEDVIFTISGQDIRHSDKKSGGSGDSH